MRKGLLQINCSYLLNPHAYRNPVSQWVSFLSDVALICLCIFYREVFEYMRQRHKEKGRSKTFKGESFTLQQLQTAREEYDDEATLFVFRLESLRQGQSRSLLTQAARHHAAQVQLSISWEFLFFLGPSSEFYF